MAPGVGLAGVTVIEVRCYRHRDCTGKVVVDAVLTPNPPGFGERFLRFIVATGSSQRQAEWA